MRLRVMTYNIRNGGEKGLEALVETIGLVKNTPTIRSPWRWSKRLYVRTSITLPLS
jgi:hypothetical protein